MASVRKVKWTHDGTVREAWAVEYTDASGKRRRKTPKSGLKKDADAMRQQVERELATGTHTVRSASVTFGHAMAEWLKDCERRWRIKDRMAGYTLKNYQKQVERVSAGLGGINLADLTAERVQKFVNDAAERLAWRTVTSRMVVIRLGLKFAVKQRWLKRNPLVDEPVRVPRNRPMKARVPSKEELRQLLSTLAARRHMEHPHAYRNRVVIILLALFAGLRRGEQCGLQWPNVNFDDGSINVAHSFSSIDGLKAPKTRAGARKVPMATPVKQGLLQLWEAMGRPEEGYVLQTKNGTPILPHHVGHAYWVPLLRDAKLLTEDGKPRYRLHDLRHTAVSLWIEAKLDPLFIKAIIGHESVSTTLDVYGHMFPENDMSRQAVVAAAAQFQVPEVPLIATRKALPSATDATKTR